MGNVNSQTRGSTVARSGAPVDSDPFAELADIFETELRFDPRFADEAPTPQRPARAGGGNPSDGMDREFEAAFEQDLAAAKAARPASMPSYETRFNGRATAKTATRGDAAQRTSPTRPTHLTDEEIDDELDTVLRNLSAPARPRGGIFVETQSFAPERPEEERLPSAPHGEIDEFEELIRSELAVIRPAVASQRRPERVAEPIRQESYIADDYEAERDYRAAAVQPRGFLRKVFVTGVSAAALVLAAGVGLSVLKGGSGMPGAGDEPLLIKADAAPYKMAPKDPGGRAYPNQNKAVYDRVTSSGKAAGDAPTQHALLKTAEEPMDLPKEEEGRSYDDLPGVEIGDTTSEGKDETRVTAATEVADASADAVLQPRKVRTLTVGADGKLVPAAEPVAGAARMETPKPAPQAAMPAPAAADPMQVSAVAPIQPAAPMTAEATAAAPAAEPAASPLPAGAFFVQVSSQPTEAAAQQSMRNFGSKYGSFVGARPVGIQSGEVAGKGTYWRVRVAASTKEEASSLCSKLKNAGASCFVTR